MALTECCISRHIARETPRLLGAQIDLAQSLPKDKETDQGHEPPPGNAPAAAEARSVRLDAVLFGESQARVVISVGALDAVKVLAQAKIFGVPAMQIGSVGGTSLKMNTGASMVDLALTELHDLWWNAIARAMQD